MNILGILPPTPFIIILVINSFKHGKSLVKCLKKHGQFLVNIWKNRSKMFDKDVGKSLLKYMKNMWNSQRIFQGRQISVYYFVSGNWVISILFYKSFICQFLLVKINVWKNMKGILIKMFEKHGKFSGKFLIKCLKNGEYLVKWLKNYSRKSFVKHLKNMKNPL